MGSLNLCNIQTIIFILIIAATIHLVKAPRPGIQTDTYDGIPPNWYSKIETDPFVKIGKKYYLFETHTKANWFEAAHICRTHHANLATIEDHAEFEAVTTYISKKSYDPTNYYWLAFNDLSEEGKFYSIGTGMPMRYNGFDSGNPDNYHDVEHCVHIWYLRNEYSMNDLACNLLLHYICEAELPKTVSFIIW